MALTRNEIRKRLTAFAREQQGASNERSQSQTFWLRFYECFGIRAESATIYEQSVKKLGGAQGFIDSFIPGKLIVEHKSRGRDLDAAFTQATEYFLSLTEADRPRYIITSDFARIRLYDLQAGGGRDLTSPSAFVPAPAGGGGLGRGFRQCKLAELPKKADWFMFLVEGQLADYTEESEADRSAAYTISKLHEALLRANFTGRDLEVLLTRILFCLFAEDTGIFGENGTFRRLIESTRADGSDTGRALAELFQVLDTPEAQRQKNLDEAIAGFAYINGALFAEPTRIPSFDSELRAQLVACAQLDWSGISPAIFGAMFQGVLEEHDVVGRDSSRLEEHKGVGRDSSRQNNDVGLKPDLPASIATRKASRRELGAHYTSERNILRVINPLCMDELRAELNKIKRNKKLLEAFYNKLPTLTFFDPACGCGNFLVIAFRELRLLEMDTIEAMSEAGLTNAGRGGLLDVSTLCRVKVSQFYGIEIDEAAAHIAKVALWITDHQMNLEAAERFGTTRPTVPLVDSATIACGNALRLNWQDVIPAQRCNYVLGNPPFVGYSYQNQEQKADMELIFGKVKGAGVLDYVACWYAKAAQYLKTPHPNPLPANGARGCGMNTFSANEARGQEATLSPLVGRGQGEGRQQRRDPKLEEKLKHYARELRGSATDAEQLIWQLLRGRQLADAKFRRQHPVGRYILDFYCDEYKIAVELDGGQHSEQQNYDQARTDFLSAQGIQVLRFWNNQALQETEAVMEVIWQALNPSPAPHPNPLPVNGAREQEATLSPLVGRWQGEGHEIACAFVSTNSITQGEQVGILWSYLQAQGIQIHFAHRTFQWSNEGKGVAAVHCVIVGFGLLPSPADGRGAGGEGLSTRQKIIFDYGDNIKGEPTATIARNINPYLVDAPTVFIEKRRTPICAAPEMTRGSSPIDGGNLLLSDEDKLALLAVEPQAEKWLRPYLMGDEFINGITRWCLWLQGISPAELRAMPQVLRRVEGVKAMRLASSKAATVAQASTPTLFGEIRQPTSARYLAIPKVSSERRRFIPIGYLDASVICGDKIFFISDADLFTFGVLSSTMHNAWMRTTCGRLKSDYSYSNTIVYNNFPWSDLPRTSVRPELVEGHSAVHASTSSARTGKEMAIETAAQAVLDARAMYSESTLADLYDPLAMPPELVKAHAALDKAVDAAYGYKGGKDDAPRVAFLFERYQALTSLLPATPLKKSRQKG